MDGWQKLWFISHVVMDIQLTFCTYKPGIAINFKENFNSTSILRHWNRNQHSHTSTVQLMQNLNKAVHLLKLMAIFRHKQLIMIPIQLFQNCPIHKHGWHLYGATVEVHSGNHCWLWFSVLWIMWIPSKIVKVLWWNIKGIHLPY